MSDPRQVKRLIVRRKLSINQWDVQRGEQMICNDCGAALVKTARFCASCGSATYLDQVETRLQRNDTAPINPDPTGNQGLATQPPAPAYTTAPAVGHGPLSRLRIIIRTSSPPEPARGAAISFAAHAYTTMQVGIIA